LVLLQITLISGTIAIMPLSNWFSISVGSRSPL
jgi:hypothetical protein